MTKTILVAMSGGVDSSTTALNLLEKGYNVIGVTLFMDRKCDKTSINDAKKVAELLKIKHEVLDVSDLFKENIIDYFINSYINGDTPNPCALCNKTIKFKIIIDYMKEIKADYIATGHYARIIEKDNRYELHKAVCLKKDQSYFLSTLDYDYLQYIKFPLGNELNKDNVRDLAKKANLFVAEKKDSQDVCFVDTDYKKFLIENSNYSNKSGLIKYLNGDILGEHNGIINYTIGQRKGLGVSYKEPIYVIRIDTIDNTVYVGSESDLFNDTLTIVKLNLLKEINKNKEYTIKLRSTHKGQLGIIKNLDNNTAKIKLKEKARAITKGQLCCIYDDTRVIGSGWIMY